MVANTLSVQNNVDSVIPLNSNSFQNHSLPPEAIDQEEYLLGNMLLSDSMDLINKIKKILNPKDFLVEAHSQIFQAAIELSQKGIIPNLMEMRKLFQAKPKHFDKFGGTPILHRLAQRTQVDFIVHPNLNRCIELIKEAANRRNLISFFHSAIQATYDQTVNLKDICHQIKNHFSSFGRSKKVDTYLAELEDYTQEKCFFEAGFKAQAIMRRYRKRPAEFWEDLNRYQQDRESKNKKRMYSIGELADLPRENYKYLIPGFLPRGESVILHGHSKLGKTLLTLDATYATITGGKFLGEKCQQGKVLFYGCDQSEFLFKDQLFYRGILDLQESHGRDCMRFCNDLRIDRLDKFINDIDDYQPDLVIIDHLTAIAALENLDINSPQFSVYFRKLVKITTERKISLIVLHHDSKDPNLAGSNKMQGSALIPSIVWGMWNISAKDPRNKSNTNRIFKTDFRSTFNCNYLLNVNSNYEWEDKGCLNFESDLDDSDGSIKSTSEQIYSMIVKAGDSGIELTEIIGKSTNKLSIYRAIRRLEERQLIYSSRNMTDKRRKLMFASQAKNGKNAYSKHTTPKKNNSLDGGALDSSSCSIIEENPPKSIAETEVDNSVQLNSPNDTVKVWQVNISYCPKNLKATSNPINIGDLANSQAESSKDLASQEQQKMAEKTQKLFTSTYTTETICTVFLKENRRMEKRIEEIDIKEIESVKIKDNPSLLKVAQIEGKDKLEVIDPAASKKLKVSLAECEEIHLKY